MICDECDDIMPFCPYGCPYGMDCSFNYERYEEDLE